jgi:hypothetical protein
MRKLLGLTAVGLLWVIATLAPGATANSDTPCTGVLLAVTVENVVVPPNAVCNLVGTQVLGNVRVETNATLQTRNANIRGNVWSFASFFTDLYTGTRVGGDVQIKNSAVDTDICGTEIGGDLQFESVRGTLDSARVGVGFHPATTGCVPATSRVIVHGNFQAWDNLRGIDLEGSQIDGNVQLFDNPGGGHRIFLNQIRGGLQCRGNGAMIGAGNVAAYKEGQCAAF